MKQQTFTTKQMPSIGSLKSQLMSQGVLALALAIVACLFLQSSARAQDAPQNAPTAQADFNPPGTKQAMEGKDQAEMGRRTTLAQEQASTASFAFPSFNSLVDLSLGGNARSFYDRLRLTPAQPYQSGAVWSLNKQLVNRGFETTFQVQITNPDYYYGGADGFAFVIHNNSPWA